MFVIEGGSGNALLATARDTLDWFFLTIINNQQNFDIYFSFRGTTLHISLLDHRKRLQLLNISSKNYAAKWIAE